MNRAKASSTNAPTDLNLKQQSIRNLDQPLNVKDKLDMLNKVMYGVVLVVAVGFIGMVLTIGAVVVDYLAEKKSSTDTLRQEITSQGDKIDRLAEELRVSNSQRSTTPTEQQTVDPAEQ